MMAEGCALCPLALACSTYNGPRPTQQECYKLFHQSCPACSLVQSQERFIYVSCQHLKLRHLVKYVKPEIRREFLFRLRKGLANFSVMPKCPFCRIVNHMVVVGLSKEQLSKMKQTDYIISLDSFSPQDPQLGSSTFFLADIAIFLGDDTIGYAWVGNLYIDDIIKGKIFHLDLHIRNRFAKELKSPPYRPLEK